MNLAHALNGPPRDKLDRALQAMRERGTIRTHAVEVKNWPAHGRELSEEEQPLSSGGGSMRRAAKTDSNQRQIVAALRQIGADVYDIKKPVDLAVGFRGRTVLLEIKNVDGRNRLTKAQEEFFHTYRGEAYIVQDVSQALKAVMR